MVVDLWLASAAIVSAFTLGVHLIAGGAGIARPLLKCQSLELAPKETLYFVWHTVTLMLAVLTVGLGYCALYDPDNRPLIITLAVLGSGSGVLNIILALSRKVSLTVLVQWTLLLPIGVLALIGMIW
jgi:hypothetical protein